MKTKEISLKCLASPLLLSVPFSSQLSAAPKGAELLLRKPIEHAISATKSGILAVSPSATSIAPGLPTNSYTVVVSTDNEDCALLFEATLRDATDGVIGVKRVQSENERETRLEVCGSFDSVDLLERAIRESLERVSRIGLLQGGAVIGPAQIPFSNPIFTKKDGVLEIRLTGSLFPPKSASVPSAPVLSGKTNASAPLFAPTSISHPLGDAGAKPPASVQRAESSFRHPIGEAVHHPSGIASAVRKDVVGEEAQGDGKAGPAFAIGILFLCFLFSAIGAWVSVRAAWRKLSGRKSPPPMLQPADQLR